MLAALLYTVACAFNEMLYFGPRCTFFISQWEQVSVLKDPTFILQATPADKHRKEGSTDCPQGRSLQPLKRTRKKNVVCKISPSLSDISGESQRQTGNNTATQNVIFKLKVPVTAAFIWDPPVVLKRLFAPAPWHYQLVLFAAFWNVSCLTFPGWSHTVCCSKTH